jgi:type I restriction enzyme, S subunit
MKRISNNLPKDWTVKKLGDLGSFSKGSGITKDELVEVGIPCIRYGEIYTKHDFVISEYHSFISPEMVSQSRKIEKNDILFAGSGETLEDIGKAVAFIGDDEVYAGGDIIILSPEGCNSVCLSYILNSQEVVRQRAKLGQGNSVVHIYSKDLGKLKISLPPLPEQKKIAQILSTWDESIQATQSLIKKLEIQKKGLMQRLLSGETRIQGFENSKWQLKKLRELITPTIREVPKPNREFLGLGLRSHGKGTFLKHNFDPKKIEMESLFTVRENDLIVNITFAWEGAIAIASMKDDGALVSHRFPTYTFIDGQSSCDFFRHFIRNPRLRFLLGLISPGGAGRNRVMSKKDFLQLEFMFPNIEEQTAIAKILDTAEAELNETKGYLETLKQQKKGLMQQLLTGRIIVKTK